MLTELNVLDHTILDEEHHQMLMLIFDTEDVWQVKSSGGIFNKYQTKKLSNKRNAEHLICLNKKIENYLGYIQENGIQKSFPSCENPAQYSYEIHIVTDFSPAPDYLELIEKWNQYITQQRADIIISNEVRLHN